MRKNLNISLALIALFALGTVQANDTLKFKGQLSAYTLLNTSQEKTWAAGGRFIPQLNYEINTRQQKLIDFEASANLYGHAAFHNFDSGSYSGRLKPYRLWGRYSTPQFELRAGLQKINFGSASLLRPLMWFDQMDPRDPLQLTDGVWAVLARYYFMNNANLWLWGLYGNEQRKGWEVFATRKQTPEFGGRLQIPVPRGESGFTYHHRTANGSGITDSLSPNVHFQENRFGFDAKFDMLVGWWIEASWSNYNESIAAYRNQEIINLGVDYTFGLGNGISLIYEHLVAASDEKAFAFSNVLNFSLLNVSYPLGLFDRLGAIVYYDWTNQKAYSFLNWQRQFNKLTLHVMGYINPKTYELPAQDIEQNLYAGTGGQLMLVYNF